jgi:DNA-binding response OmpR family regulator
MTIAIHIAIVEDHDDLRDLFVDFLENVGHIVAGFSCADDLDDYLAAHSVDLIVLDLNLPGEDGFSIAKRLRESHPDLYIIIISARTALDDRIRGYASGADQYFIKPVVPEELIATVGSVARRLQLAQDRQVNLVLDNLRLELAGPIKKISITQPESILIKALAEATGHKVETWRLCELLGLKDDDNNKSVLEVRISRLKKKLHESGAVAPAIKSVRNVGYQLCVGVVVQN